MDSDRLTVEQYHEMIRSGVIDEDDPVELLDGWLVAKDRKTPPHSAATGLTRDALAKAVPAEFFVDSHDPVTLATSEPEPDVVIIRGQPRDYAEHHPGPSDVVLVVEVSDSSLGRDRGFKKSIYARAVIPSYWIINLIDRRIEVYSVPAGTSETADYRPPVLFSPGEKVPLVIDGREVAWIEVSEMLP